MFCKNCGKEILCGSKFCKNCGSFQGTAVQRETPDSCVRSNNAGGKGKKGVVWKIICCVLVLSLISGIIQNIAENDGLDNSGKIETIDGDSVTDGSILSKTVMFYMDGADLEEKHASATDSIQEIINSSVDTDANNILIYTGGCNLWHNYNIPTDKDCIYLLRNGTLNLLMEYPASNVGKQETLQTFMDYCVTNYPAQQYGLVLSDHGGGPNIGVCEDQRNNRDTLSMEELQGAFSSVGFGPDNKMEFVIFECCLMASIETANCIKDYANYMIGSENVSYTYGSDYSFVESFDTCNSGADIGKAFVDKFYSASIDNVTSLVSQGYSYDNVYDVTYSCLDLSKVDQLEQTLDDFFKEINNQPLMKLAVSLGSYDARGVAVIDGTSWDLIDLKDFVSQYEAYYPQNVGMINNAMDELVVYNRASTSKMAGVTIYYPHYTDVNYDYDSFDFSPEYSKYVKAIFDESKNANSVQQWNSISALAQEQVANQDLGGLAMQLTEEQSEKFGSANYYILAKYNLDDYTFGNNEYVIVTSGNDVTLDDNNMLKANYDKRVPVAVTKDGNITPFCSPLFRTKKDENVFYNLNCSLHFVPDEKDFTGERDEEGLNVLTWQIDNMKLDVAKITLALENNDFEIICAEKTSDGLPSRILLNVNDYNEIVFDNFLRRAQFDNSGNVLPVDKWEVSSKSLSTSYFIGDVDMKMEYITNTNGADVQYFGMMVITDIYGNEYATDITSLNN